MPTIFKPAEVPLRGLRTSLKPPQLADGYFQALSNLRWDSGLPTVRGGISTIGTAPGGSTTCLGAWSGTLNGTWYVICAWVISGKTAIYSLNVSTGAFTEITSIDGHSGGGGSGVPTWGGNQATAAGISAGGTELTNAASDVTFTVHSLPRRVIGGQVQAPVDVLSIQNLEDYPLIYNPSLKSLDGFSAENLKVFRHKPILLQPGCTTFTYYARLSAFLQIADTSAHRTYLKHGADGANQSRWVAGDTLSAPYNSGSNYCVLLTMASALDGDSVGITFPASAVQLPGEQLNFAVEGSPAAVYDAFTNVRLDIGSTVVASGSVSSVSNPIAVAPNPCVIGTGSAHGLADGGSVLLTTSGSIGGIVGGWYFAKASGYDSTHFGLYNDQALTKPVDNTTTSVTGGSTWSNIPLYPVYDSSSADATLTIAPKTTGFDSGNNRYLVTYNLKTVASWNRGCKYVKLTHNGSFNGNYSLTILLMACAGSGGGFFGDTEFWINWRDRFSEAESAGIAGVTTGGDLLKNAGGPSVVTSGSGSIAGTKLPVSPDVLYDFSLHLTNPGTVGTIYGGLEGLPNCFDIYFRTSAESQAGLPALYWLGLKLYDNQVVASDHVWLMVWANAPGGTPFTVFNVTTEGYYNGQVARDLRDPGVPAPGAYNTAMPRAKVVWTAQQRTFAGAVKDTSGSYQYSDLYFSRERFPFRFQSVQDDTPESGSRLIFPGEQIRAGIMTAAAASYASIIYVLTDISFSGLGSSVGMFFDRQGSSFDATALSTRVRINGHGTNEPASFAEHMSVLFFADQEGQLIRFEQGQAQSISRFQVDDKIKGIPSGRRGKICSTYWKDRWYIAYTPLGGSANTHILGWNEVMRDWEFDDTLPSGISAVKMVRAFDSNQIGSGQRLLIFSGDGNVYGYEEGTVEPGNGTGPLARMTTREYQSRDANEFRFGYVSVMADASSNSLTVDAYYRPDGTLFRGSISLANPNSAAQSVKTEAVGNRTQYSGGNPVNPGDAAERAEQSWSGYLDLYGNLPAGAVIWRVEADLEPVSQGAAER